MLTILLIVAPVFLVVAAGYVMASRELISADAIDVLMKFAQNIAIPAMLFLALYRLDLSVVFDWELLISFYTGAVICFVLGVFGAKRLFNRRPGESIAIGFGALFSNSVLLGLAIMESAYGLDALAPNFLLIAFHAPFCYLLGITWMEGSRADGRSRAETAKITLIAMFKTPVTACSLAGLAANLLALPIPDFVAEAGDILGRAGLPLAIFGLGGVLARYRIQEALGEALMITALSTLLHPAIAYTLSAHVFELEQGFVRSAVVMAAMAPGVNAYVFASMYGRAVGAAASTVLISTLVCVATASFWLWVLGGASIG
ncbi:MAG: AEC family transporter [Pseudomonadota bacterium]